MGWVNTGQLQTNISPTSILENISFKFDLIDEKKITHVARCLHNKSSSGKDGISLKLLKYLLPGLSKPLTLIINQSLLAGIFPDRLNIAKVIQLYKNGMSQYWTTTDQYLSYQHSRKYLKK